jgi:putative transposase
MSMVPRFDRYALDDQLRDFTTWPMVNVGQLTKKRRKRLERYQGAIGKYLAGGKVSDLCKAHSVSRSELHRALRRCLRIHEDGQIWGFRALISYTHQNGYQRIQRVVVIAGSGRGGRSGALTQLFDKFPQLAEVVKSEFLKKHSIDKIHEARVPLKAVHKRMLTACRRLGLTAKDYPLNQKYLGRSSLHKYLQGLMNTPAAVAARCGEAAARNFFTDGTEFTLPRVLRPLQQVEFDGHRIDQMYTVRIPSPYGGFERKTIERFWILAIIETVTRVILGYVISLNHEYNQDDVLRCVKTAVTPWEVMKLTIDGLSYPAEGCFHSDTYPDLKWAVWEEFKWDNAKAHLAEKTLDRMCRTIGCTPNPGPVANPNRRPFIERWFYTFEQSVSRLPATTGSHPKDPKRRNPEKAALHYEIWFEEIEQVVSLIVAEYNNDPHSGIGNRSPFEHLGILLQDKEMKQMIRKVPETTRSNLRLLDQEVTRQVRGSVKNGRRCYVEFESVRYTNALLSRSPELIGRRLRLFVDPENASSLRAFLPNGAELGVLTAHGIWGRTPHTLEARKAIFALRRRKLIRYTERDDVIQVYLDFLAKRALLSKRGASQYEKARRAHQARNDKPKKATSTPPPDDEPLEDTCDHVPVQVITYKGMVF